MPREKRGQPPSDALATVSHDWALPEGLEQYDQSRQLGSQSLDPLTERQGEGKTTASSRSQHNELGPNSINEFLENHRRSSSRDRRLLENGSSMVPPPTTLRHSHAVGRQYNPTPARKRQNSTITVDSSSTAMSSVFDAHSWHDSEHNSLYSASICTDDTTIQPIGTHPPLRNSAYSLPCEFVAYASCDQYFSLEEADQWMEHIIVDHLGSRLPDKSACWFCDDDFDASRDGVDKLTHFRNRLDHIRVHIKNNNYDLETMKPDLAFRAHIEELGLVAKPILVGARLPLGGLKSALHDRVPPERQQQHRQSQAVVVNEKSGGKESNKSSDGQNRRHLGQFDSSNRMTQNKPDSRRPLPSNVPPATGIPSIFHEDNPPLSMKTSAHQKAVMEGNYELKPEVLESEKLSSRGTTESTDELLKNPQQQSKSDRIPQGGSQHQLHSISGIMKAQWLTSLQYPESPPINEEDDEFKDSHHRIQRTSESHPPPLCTSMVGMEVPRRLDEADAPRDANTSTYKGYSLDESSQPKLESPENMRLSPSRMDEISSNDGYQSSADRNPLTRPIQTPDSSGVTTSESSTTYQEGSVSCSSLSTRQVGLVRVRIERISLFDHCLADSDSGDDLDKEADVTEDDRDEGVTDNESSYIDNQEPGESSSAAPKESQTSSKRPSLAKRNWAAEEGSDGEQDERRNGPDRKRKKTVCTKQPVRFACPYQAFDTFQDCLKSGSRNPQGGCAGINRLKQHLSRRHMESYRCQRCWGVFDSRRKASEHEAQETQCSPREKPPNENFMTYEQEAEIETACRSVSAEESWWNLFRLLIPGMQGQDIMSLMLRYCPYYINRHSTFIIPSLTVSNISFESAPQATSNVQEAMHNTTSAVPDPSSSHGLTFNIPGTPSEIQPEVSQTVNIPLLQVIDSAAADNDFSTFLRTTGIGTSNQLNLDSGSSSSSDNFAASLTPGTVFEASGLPEISLNNQAQQTRNHERLRDRNRQSEATIAALRRTMHGTLEDLNHADNLVEDLLNLGNLTDVMYDKLANLSSVLGSAREKLQ